MRLFLLLFSLCYFINITIAEIRSHGSRNNKLHSNNLKRYQPDWSDLDTRPLPRWYDEAKVGIFLHWGVYSVPSFGSEWFWINWSLGSKKQQDFMRKNYPPGFTYQDFAPMFTTEFFDSDKWAKLFAKSGAKYIVLTSKHHEGYTLFPSKKTFSWNSVETGPKRDLVGELAFSVREHGLKFGVYHSLFEWFNPIYLEDKQQNFTKTRTFVDTKLWPDLKQLIHDYEPSVIWSDGDWEAYDTYWKSKEFLAWLYNDSPIKDEVVVNDRWGIGIPGKHGDFYNFADRFNNRTLQKHKWENAFTVDSLSWGYRRDMDISEILTPSKLIEELVTTVSCGGNVLINVGPTKEGTICPIFQERLLALGKWLDINGEAIYSSSPWTSQNDTINGDVWYTCKRTKYNAANPTAVPPSPDSVTAIYAITLKWPKEGVLEIRDIATYLHSGNYNVKLLGNDGYLQWFLKNGKAQIQLPSQSETKSTLAWTLKFTKK